jgi:hypothetical protein
VIESIYDFEASSTNSRIQFLPATLVIEEHL